MSEIKVNKISPRTACGTTTLGDSGDTFTIPAGVTITNSGTAAGFGATGAASWDTTVKTSSPFTAVSGVGYFVNTTAGAISVNLPAGTAGAVVAIKDYAGTFDSNACTLVQNGSDKIGGVAANATLSTEGIAVTLVFVDSTQGWLVTDSGLQDEAPGPLYLCASVSGAGNAITTAGCGNYKIATFTGPGDFTVNSVGNPAGGGDAVEYLMTAGGGGGGGQYIAGGGGAGGFRFASPSLAPATYPAKPIAAPAGITVTAQAYPIVIGGGGTGNGSAGNTDSTRGGNTTGLGLTTTGGGAGKQDQGPGNDTGQPGGSGGGGAGGAPATGPNAYVAGNGNTPPVSPPQGNNGGAGMDGGPGIGAGSPFVAGGGGGAMAVGGCGTRPNSTGGLGGVGAGVPNAFGTSGQSSGGYYYFSGGGGGNASTCGGGAGPATSGTGGLGGGGAGTPNAPGTAGTVNTGGGGGGTDSRPGPNAGGAGGSGIVIIRYKFQN